MATYSLRYATHFGGAFSTNQSHSALERDATRYLRSLAERPQKSSRLVVAELAGHREVRCRASRSGGFRWVAVDILSTSWPFIHQRALCRVRPPTPKACPFNLS